MAVEWNDQGFQSRVRKAVMRGVSRWILDVENESVRLIMQGPKTGEVYDTRFFTIGSGPTRKVIPYGSRPAHQASAPGEAPANDTGTLANNRVVTLFEERLAARLSHASKHALFMQFGTDRIEPRPWLDKALDSQAEAGLQHIKDELSAEFGSGAVA